jgi:hypothetical protein
MRVSTFSCEMMPAPTPAPAPTLPPAIVLPSLPMVSLPPT